MATTTYEALQDRQEQLIRKALEGSIFCAPHSAPAVTSITSGASGALQTLPIGYTDVGWVDKKTGSTWTRKPTTADVESWGSTEPTRRDITKDQRNLHVMMQETKLATLQMSEGLDLSTTTANATSKEVTFDSPPRPQNIYYRIFGLFVDGTGADTIYVGRFMPKANVIDVGDQVWTDGDAPVVYDVTLAANFDSAEGTSMRFFFGGPGWAAILSDVGFSVASGS